MTTTIKSICVEGFYSYARNTLIEALHKKLEESGKLVYIYRSPNYFVELLTSRNCIYLYPSFKSRVFLLAADLVETVRKIREDLSSSPEAFVLMDTFVWSVLARYHSYTSSEVLNSISSLLLDGFMPDLVVYLKTKYPTYTVKDQVIQAYDNIFENFKDTKLLKFSYDTKVDSILSELAKLKELRLSSSSPSVDNLPTVDNLESLIETVPKFYDIHWALVDSASALYKISYTYDGCEFTFTFPLKQAIAFVKGLLDTNAQS